MSRRGTNTKEITLVMSTEDFERFCAACTLAQMSMADFAKNAIDNHIDRVELGAAPNPPFQPFQPWTPSKDAPS